MRIEPSKQIDYLEEISAAYRHHFHLNQLQLSPKIETKVGMSLSDSECLLVKTWLQLLRPKLFLEIGTFFGKSALWLVHSLDRGGVLYTIENNPEHASIAEKHFQEFHQQEARKEDQKKIELLQGDAISILSQWKDPVDGVFIDANKSAYLDYLDWAEKFVKPGGVIIADNIFLGGKVYDESIENQWSDKQVQKMKEFNKRLMNPARYDSAIVPTKEGLIIGIRRPESRV